MSANYSKLLMSSIIATSCFMMSCQKKGTARTGVQPQTATAKQTTDNQTSDKGNTNPNPGDITLNPPVVKDPKPTDPVKPPAVDPKPTEPTNPPVVTDPKPTEPVNPPVVTDPKPTEPVKPPAVDPKPTVAECSSDVLEEGKKLTDLVNKVKAEDDKTTKEDKTKNRADILVACEEWINLFKKEKIESCKVINAETKKENSIGILAWNEGCYATGDQLKALTGEENKYTLAKAKYANDAVVKALIAEKSVFSEEAKELLDMKNQNFKKYMLEGKIQSDEKALSEAIKANKVACSLNSKGEVAYTEDTTVAMKIVSIDTLVAIDSASEVQKGIDLAVNLEITSKAKPTDEAKSQAAIVSCTNLDAKKLDAKALKAALGSLIAVKAK